MSRDQIADKWRATLVGKLQDRYGLNEEDACEKVQAWLDWLQTQPEPQGGPATETRKTARR